MTRFFTIQIALLLSVTNVVIAHQESSLHELCSKARDYKGCINFQKYTSTYDTQKSNNQHLWRSYGPLDVNWSLWKDKGTSRVTLIKNRNGQSLYLAINCRKRMINVSGSRSLWKGWEPPNQQFEQKLILDFCRNSFN